MSKVSESSAESSEPASESLLPRLTRRDPVTVRPHPAYAEILDAGTVDVPDSEGEPAAVPILITNCGTLIAGHSRWQRALRRRDRAVLCLEYDLSEDAALEWCIRLHATPAALNDYCRIRLALELETHRRTTAAQSTPDGGHSASKLTTHDRNDVRRDIARIAGVSTGNVTKVKQLRKAIIPELDSALRERRISIHQAWKLSQLPKDQQRTAFLERRHERAVDRTIQKLTRQHVWDRAKRLDEAATIRPADVLTTLANSELRFSLIVVPAQCLMVAISQGLYDTLLRERTG